MKRTRKWAFVAQEAKRLSDLGLGTVEIAKRLEVNRSTITRWIAAGKIGQKAAKDAKRRARVLSVGKGGGKSPQAWAAAVKKEYDLDATDEQLVTLAKSALTMAQDRTLKPRERMSAMAEFRANVKQLALVARGEEASKGDQAPQAEEQPKPIVPVRREDPRKLVMVVSK